MSKPQYSSSQIAAMGCLLVLVEFLFFAVCAFALLWFTVDLIHSGLKFGSALGAFLGLVLSIHTGRTFISDLAGMREVLSEK